MKNKHLEPIAVVGIGAIMPGALTKDEFWSNIKEGKYCITEIPASYWDYKLFYSSDHKAEDKLYSKIGGFQFPQIPHSSPNCQTDGHCAAPGYRNHAHGVGRFRL